MPSCHAVAEAFLFIECIHLRVSVFAQPHLPCDNLLPCHYPLWKVTALAHLLPAASDNSVCRWVTGWKGCAFKNIKCVRADCACVYNPLLLIRDNSEVSRGGERGQGLTFWAVVSPAGRLTHTSVSGAVGYYFSPAKSALLCHHESV